MSVLTTTCPDCGRQHEVDINCVRTTCMRCGLAFDPFGEDAGSDYAEGQDPDFGGAVDGFGNVFSDADPGL